MARHSVRGYTGKAKISVEVIENMEELVRRGMKENESVYPGYYVAMRMMFLCTPKHYSLEGIGIEDFHKNIKMVLGALVSDCTEYISRNSDLVDDICNISPGFTVLEFENFMYIDGYKDLNAIDEQRYVDRANSEGERKKRIKLLAALDVIRQASSINDIFSSSETKLFAAPMFAFFRSMLQFMFYEYYYDGLNMQIKREEGAKQQKDRTGIKLLMKDMVLGKNLKAIKAWESIKNLLVADGLITFDNEYAVEFEQDEKDKRTKSGCILQTDPEGKPGRMTYESFKKIFREVEKKGS